MSSLHTNFSPCSNIGIDDSTVRMVRTTTFQRVKFFLSELLKKLKNSKHYRAAFGGMVLERRFKHKST